MMALRAGNEELAKEALARKKEHDALAETFKEQWTKQKNAVDQLKKALRMLNDKIEEAKRKKNVLIARKKRAEAQKAIQETMHGLKRPERLRDVRAHGRRRSIRSRPRPRPPSEIAGGVHGRRARLEVRRASSETPGPTTISPRSSARWACSRPRRRRAVRAETPKRVEAPRRASATGPSQSRAGRAGRGARGARSRTAAAASSAKPDANAADARRTARQSGRSDTTPKRRALVSARPTPDDDCRRTPRTVVGALTGARRRRSRERSRPTPSRGLDDRGAARGSPARAPNELPVGAAAERAASGSSRSSRTRSSSRCSSRRSIATVNGASAKAERGVPRALRRRDRDRPHRRPQRRARLLPGAPRRGRARRAEEDADAERARAPRRHRRDHRRRRASSRATSSSSRRATPSPPTRGSLQTINLATQEAALTGESLPVAKDARAELADDAPIGDRVDDALHRHDRSCAARAARSSSRPASDTELGKLGDAALSVERAEDAARGASSITSASASSGPASRSARAVRAGASIRGEAHVARAPPRGGQPRGRGHPRRPARDHDDHARARHAAHGEARRDRPQARRRRDARRGDRHLLRQDRHAHAERDDGPRDLRRHRSRTT